VRAEPAVLTCPEVSAPAFRLAARAFPTGVAVLTVAGGSRPRAKTVSSFTTVSLDPPLVSVALSCRAALLAQLRERGRFGVSVLGAGQEAVSRYFAAPARERPGLGPPPRLALTAAGTPVVAGSQSYFDCHLSDVLALGDHAVVVGRVTAVDGGPTAAPLVYFDGGYRLLARPEKSRCL